MKKLTAGIFTVMMGLVAANSADAAVASKGYVDTKVGDNTTLITNLTQTVEGNKSAADTAIAEAKKAGTDASAALESYKTTNDARVLAVEGEVDTLQTTVGEQATAISGINTKLESVATTEGLAELTGDVNALQTQVGEGNVADRIATAKQAAIDAAAADATSKANAAEVAAKSYADGLASNYDASGSAASALADAKSYADGLDAAQKTAFESADTAINAKIGTVAQGKTVVEMIAEAQTAATYDDTKVKEDIAKNAQAIADEEQARETAVSGLDARITTNTTAITTLNGDKDTAGSVAKSIADAFTAANLSQYETVEGALGKYAQKTSLKALAYKDTVGTADIDNQAVTTAKLADGAVDSNKLGKDAVTDNAVANGALSQDKINGLSATLNTKLNIPDAANETDGKYVLTATSVDGQATYYWESIER